MPATVKFCGFESEFSSNCADLTKYSENTFLLQFYSNSSAIHGFFEPVEQIVYKQKNVLHTVTLYRDGFYYIELENENSIYKKKIKDGIKEIKIVAETINGNPLAAVYGKSEDKKYCLYIGFDDDYKILGEYFADSSKIEDKKLVVNQTYNDMCRHTEELFIDFDGKTFSVSQKKNSALKPVSKKDKLIPYYFLEAIASDNLDEAITFLDNKFYQDVTPVQLKNFFESFCEITQNYYDKKYAGYVALKHKTAPSYYELKYYKFVVKDCLIENIITID